MGIRKAIAHATQEHRDLISGPHFLFSVQNPKHPEKKSIHLSHEEVLNHIKGAGHDAHEIDSGLDKSIVVYGTEPKVQEELHVLASRLGQESSISSDGEKNEMRFHHGERTGEKLNGCGTSFHEKGYPGSHTLPGGQHHFTHNLEQKLSKKEQDMTEYKKNASKGIGLMYPATIDGETTIHGTDIKYHVTVKGFDAATTDADKVKEIIDELEFKQPSADTPIELVEFTSDVGNTYKMVVIHGAFENHVKDLASHFEGMGIVYKQDLGAHMTIGVELFDKLKAKNAKTLGEANIIFSAPQLWRGNDVIEEYTYDDILEKSAGKKVMGALAIVGALAGAPHTSDAPMQHAPDYSSKKMLSAISSVESSGGKNTNHAEMHGKIHSGDHAYGKYGLTPTTVRETINMNPELKRKYSKAMHLQGNDLNHYLSDNPGLEDQIATKHLARLEHHFGRDPASIGYAWLNGIKGTNKAKKEKKDIENHWHVKKIKTAFSGAK